MPVIYFKGPFGQDVVFDCGDAGIHIPSLADELQLKARPLKLNGVIVDFTPDGYKSLKDADYLNGYGSADSPISVSGISAGAWTGEDPSAGIPHQYKDVILHVAGANREPEFVIPYAGISRPSLEKVLDRHGCDLIVYDSVARTLVGFDSIELQDNILLQAHPYLVPWEARISTLDGFLESSEGDLETDATEAMYRQLQRQYNTVEVLPVREIKSVDGKKREVDGAVIADGCAAILKAKQVLDDTAVLELESCIDFIHDNELIGPAASLKDKKLLGFMAGRTFSNDLVKVKALLKESQQCGYRILVSRRRSLKLWNSRVPNLRVDCAVRRRACGAYSCPARAVL